MPGPMGIVLVAEAVVPVVPPLPVTLNVPPPVILKVTVAVP